MQEVETYTLGSIVPWVIQSNGSTGESFIFLCLVTLVVETSVNLLFNKKREED